MDLDFLDSTSSMAPLLLRLYEGQKLDDLADRDNVAARQELIDAMSELLEMELSVRETELIADVMIELVRQAEHDLRAAIADRVSVYETTPVRLLLELANDEISIARPVLQKSPVLGDLDLIYIIKSRGTAYWQAIAGREDLGAKVIDTLANTNDFETAMVLVQNRRITLTNHAVLSLATLAQGKDTLAKPLLSRDEMTQEIATDLYAYVGEVLKCHIKEQYQLSETISHAVDEVVGEFIGHDQNAYLPSEEMILAAQSLHAKDQLTLERMMQSLQRGQIKSFIAQFCVFSDMKAQNVLTALEENDGKTLALICRAKDIAQEDFLSIFLLTNRVRNKGKTVRLDEMNQALNYFSKVKPYQARALLVR